MLLNWAKAAIEENVGINWVYRYSLIWGDQAHTSAAPRPRKIIRLRGIVDAEDMECHPIFDGAPHAFGVPMPNISRSVDVKKNRVMMLKFSIDIRHSKIIFNKARIYLQKCWVYFCRMVIYSKYILA